ncbi:uncharacterized protein LOC117475741 isoform X3 [Trematomus bernacchii]|uniref:uncharacterized protein LOC117475741 isoform X3 n=1 Tax=Trematomus bernacchii TaxID=40690 RepID=UPI00146CBF07|nr:uncharacterized protein LOC117475741 isoform X3 [Trematomus bernacchii]
MQTDRSRQQDRQVPESQEMSSSTPPEPEPSSPQREKDQHQEDRPGATDSNSMTSTTANKQIVSTANLIPITMDNEAIKVSDKKSSINREMKRNLGIEETSAMPPSLKRRLKDQDNQYAAEMKGGEIQMFDEVQRSDVATHTESILCEHIDETLQRRPTEVKNNDLNTHYSPCSMREGDIDPTDLNPIDQFDVNVSVGHDDCQPLHGLVSYPNLTDRSTQQDPQVPETEEMSSSPPTEPEPSSPQREKDQHQEDRPGATDSNSGTSPTANTQNMSTANLIPITMDNEAIKVSDKKSSINREMKRNLGIEETSAMPPSLKRRLKDQDNQYAAEMKSGEFQMFDEVQRSDVATHTESILCEHIDETLQRRPTEVKNNDLNTHYSPCSMREGDIDPTDLNPIDQFDVNVSVGHDDCQPLHGLVSYPNLTDRSTQQDPQVPESEEMSSSPPTEPEPSSPQREKDQHQEDRPGAIDSNSGTSTTANKQNVLLANVIPITMDNLNELLHMYVYKLRCIHVMKRNSEIESGFSIAAPCAGRPFQMFLKHRLKNDHKQYAYAVVVMEDFKGNIFKAEYPDPCKKKHSEEILIGELDNFLQKCGTKVRYIYIYTYNSPCLKSRGKIPGCMFQLIEKAYQWDSQFGIVTKVCFEVPWGLCGPGIFKRQHDFSSWLVGYSALYPDVNLCPEIRFTLDTKKLEQEYKPPLINENIKDRHKDVQEAFKSAHNGFHGLANSSEGFLKSQHLEHGLKYIDSLKFPPEFSDTIIETLRKNWTSDFNYAVVKLTIRDIRLDLGNNNFFQIHQVPPGAEVEE